MTISNPITYSKEKTECNVCLEDTNSYIKFCKCSVKTCEDCFHKLMIISDKELCDCCADTDTNMSYLKLVLKCPTCRCIHSSPLTKQVITDLKIPDKIMVNLILAFNYCVNKEMENSINYIGEFDSDSDIDEEELANNLCYRITGLMYPKVEKYDLITQMLKMGLRNFDF